jgi:Ca2+-binding EF-hand superfamily protein
MIVAHKSSSEEIGILRKVFQKYDSRQDGSISYEEFCEALAHVGHAEDDLKDMFDAVVSFSFEFCFCSCIQAHEVSYSVCG